jgi:hypothetical protein
MLINASTIVEYGGVVGIPRRKSVLRCRICGSEVDVNPRSKLCLACSTKRIGEAVEQLRAHQGPMFEAWRRGLARHLHRLSMEGQI